MAWFMGCHLSGRDALDFAPQCIDAMGLVEYLDENEVITLMGRLHRMLEPGGVLVFTNMRPTHPNLESINERCAGRESGNDPSRTLNA